MASIIAYIFSSDAMAGSLALVGVYLVGRFIIGFFNARNI